jgi:hypothetical protein
VARLMARRGRTTVPPWAKPQMATSMRRRTAKPIAIPAAVGVRKMEVRPITPILRNPARVTRTRANRGAVQVVRAAGDRRRRAAGHQLSIAEAEAGNPGRKVLVVRQAWAVGVAGAAVEAVVGDEPNFATANEIELKVLVNCLDGGSFGGNVCRA